jgi:hypothetical protein
LRWDANISTLQSGSELQLRKTPNNMTGKTRSSLGQALSP